MKYWEPSQFLEEIINLSVFSVGSVVVQHVFVESFLLLVAQAKDIFAKLLIMLPIRIIHTHLKRNFAMSMSIIVPQSIINNPPSSIVSRLSAMAYILELDCWRNLLEDRWIDHRRKRNSPHWNHPLWKGVGPGGSAAHRSS